MSTSVQVESDIACPDGSTCRATGPTHRRVRPLALAKLAIEAQEALEVLAAQEVAAARELEGSTWEQVGEVFGISTQSAHHRFARK